MFRHDLNSEEYARAIQEGAEKGYRPVSVSACDGLAGQVRFALVMTKDHVPIPWAAVAAWLDASRLPGGPPGLDRARAIRPLLISGYTRWATRLRYLAVWSHE